MNEETKDCPRCSDYDKVKQELENNKSQREKETKDALKHCKDSKARLQKKLLTLGAIAQDECEYRSSSFNLFMNIFSASDH